MYDITTTGDFDCVSSESELSTVRWGKVVFHYLYSLPVVSEDILNGILSDFWHKLFESNEFDSNVFLVLLSCIYSRSQYLNHFFKNLVKSP